jgi:hypothetical protein
MENVDEIDAKHNRQLSRAERREMERMDKKSCKKIMKAVNKHRGDPLENRCRDIFSEMLDVTFNSVLSKLTKTVNCLIENQANMEKNIEVLYDTMSKGDLENVKTLTLIRENVNAMSVKMSRMNDAINEVRGNSLCTIHNHEHSLNGKPVHVYAFSTSDDATNEAIMFRKHGFQCVRSGNVLYCIEHKLEEVPSTDIQFDYISLLVVDNLHSRAYMMLSTLNRALKEELMYSYSTPIENAKIFINTHICEYDSNLLTEKMFNDPNGLLDIVVKEKLTAKAASAYQMVNVRAVIKSVDSTLYTVEFNSSSKIVKLIRA